MAGRGKKSINGLFITFMPNDAEANGGVKDVQEEPLTPGVRGDEEGKRKKKGAILKRKKVRG